MFETGVLMKFLEMTIFVAVWRRARFCAMWKRKKVNGKILMGVALSYNVVCGSLDAPDSITMAAS